MVFILHLQYNFYADAPNKPLAMRALLPTSNREDSLKNALPTKLMRLQQLQSSLYLHRIILTISKITFPQLEEEVVIKFQSKLDKIGDGIERSNKESNRAGNAVHSYLNPSIVQACIDI